LLALALLTETQDNYLIEMRGDVQENLPDQMEEDKPDDEIKIFYMVHPSVDIDSGRV
jgi:DNA replication licensing factor MCM6